MTKWDYLVESDDYAFRTILRKLKSAPNDVKNWETGLGVVTRRRATLGWNSIFAPIYKGAGRATVTDVKYHTKEEYPNLMAAQGVWAIHYRRPDGHTSHIVLPVMSDYVKRGIIALSILDSAGNEIS